MEQISAKIVAHSKSSVNGKEIITFELTYPRLIHSELMTHRLFSRNAASSRAIPVKSVIEMVRSNPAMPVRFGANQSGMQDTGVEYNNPVDISGYCRKLTGRQAWIVAARRALEVAEALSNAGYHKQVAGRLLEPFQTMKTIVTATELENFWWLRVDADADPTIERLAGKMKAEYLLSSPEILEPGQWHTPYVDHVYEFEDIDDKECAVFVGYSVLDEEGKPVMLDVEEAKAISSSCCAQVSYRRLNNTKEKALNIYERLLSGTKVHSSPFEHQATPMEHENQLDRINFVMSEVEINQDTETWEKGVTHVDREGKFWSGNFKSWIQHRQLLDNHTKW